MSSENMNQWFSIDFISEWEKLNSHILDLEKKGLITRTFRRLDPENKINIISAILQEAVDRGPLKINIKNVAKRASISVGSLYTYFTNRENLLKFSINLCSSFIADLLNNISPYLCDLSLKDGIRSYLSEGIEWGRTQKELLKFFAKAAYIGDKEISKEFIEPVAKAMKNVVRDMLSAAISRGEIKSDIDIESVTGIVNTLLIAVGDSKLFPHINIYFQTSQNRKNDKELINSLIDFILYGLAGVEVRKGGKD